VRSRKAISPKRKSRRIQVDEIWSFTYAKQKNVPTAKRQDSSGCGGLGCGSPSTTSEPDIRISFFDRQPSDARTAEDKSAKQRRE